MTIEPAPMKKLKKMGWYWGSISPEFAAKLLEHEREGSFLVRDSSSECYIFSMTFKLEGQVHHARIEHSKGHFSFGRSPKFFCSTIVDFIEQAIEYSHNEELLFFLHRDPSMEGPIRFRMIPFSRLKSLSSLKHLCRFAILPYIRRDRMNELLIPPSLKEYLEEPFRCRPIGQCWFFSNRTQESSKVFYFHENELDSGTDCSHVLFFWRIKRMLEFTANSLRRQILEDECRRVEKEIIEVLDEYSENDSRKAELLSGKRVKLSEELRRVRQIQEKLDEFIVALNQEGNS